MSVFKQVLSLLSPLSPVHILWVKMASGARHIGTDAAGNRYFEASPRKGYKRPRRFVLYKEKPDASLIPAEWHGWIHYQTNVVPQDNAASFRRAWQKPHRPNMTGTDSAYHPKGHVLAGGQRDKATGDYVAWKPEE